MSGNLRLQFDDKTIFDATGCTLTMNRETKQRAATKDTSSGSATKSTKTWTASWNGLAVYASDGVGTHDFFDLFDLYDNDLESANPTVQFMPDEGDATHYLEGPGIITQLGGNWNVDEDGTANLQITGAGALVKVAIP